MHRGLSLQELAAKIENDARSQKDLIAPTDQIRMTVVDNDVNLSIDGHGQYGINENTHGQISARLAIPKKYYDRMLSDAPTLLSQNVNTWFQANPEPRMVRTITDRGPAGTDGLARAFLSNRYRRIDHIMVAQAVLPQILEHGGLTPIQNAITDNHLFMKFVNPRVEAEVAVGDPVQAGFAITNSEVGKGAYSVEMFLYRLICLNGMITQTSIRKFHSGRAWDAEGEAYEVFSDATLEADDRVLMMKMQDLVKVALEQSKFDTLVEKARLAAGTEVTSVNLMKSVEVLSNHLGIGQDLTQIVTQNLLMARPSNGKAHHTLWDYANAVTSVANHEPLKNDFDRQHELQKLGSEVLGIPATVIKEMTIVE